MSNIKESLENSLKLNLLYRFILLFQILSLVFSYTTGFLSGDYISYEFRNGNNLIFGFISCMVPFFLIKEILKKNKKVEKKFLSIDEIAFFKYIVLFLLLLNILFSYFFGVGKSATDIYDAPILLKPFIIIVNRININILAGFLLLSKRVTLNIKLLVLFGLILLALSRASISIFLFLFLLLLIKNNKSNRSGNTTLYSIVVILFVISILILGPVIYQFRDSYRNGNLEINFVEILETTNYFDFILGKIIGRISNISSYVFFVENINLIKSSAYKLNYFSYFIEFLKPIWGSVIDFKFNSYTYYFTNLFDSNAGYDYGIMYGIPAVLILSYFSFPILPFIVILLILVTVILIIKISKRLFGSVYREFVFILLFFPLTSGVASEFFQIFFDLSLLYLLKLICLSFNSNNRISKH